MIRGTLDIKEGKFECTDCTDRSNKVSISTSSIISAVHLLDSNTYAGAFIRTFFTLLLARGRVCCVRCPTFPMSRYALLTAPKNLLSVDLFAFVRICSHLVIAVVSDQAAEDGDFMVITTDKMYAQHRCNSSSFTLTRCMCLRATICMRRGVCHRPLQENSLGSACLECSGYFCGVVCDQRLGTTCVLPLHLNGSCGSCASTPSQSPHQGQRRSNTDVYVQLVWYGVVG